MILFAQLNTKNIICHCLKITNLIDLVGLSIWHTFFVFYAYVKINEQTLIVYNFSGDTQISIKYTLNT